MLRSALQLSGQWSAGERRFLKAADKEGKNTSLANTM